MTPAQRKGALIDLAVVNALLLLGAAGISLAPSVPLPLTIALAVTSISLIAVAGWITAHTIIAIRKIKNESSPE